MLLTRILTLFRRDSFNLKTAFKNSVLTEGAFMKMFTLISRSVQSHRTGSENHRPISGHKYIGGCILRKRRQSVELLILYPCQPMLF
jgi:hypothetical protein